MPRSASAAAISARTPSARKDCSDTFNSSGSGSRSLRSKHPKEEREAQSHRAAVAARVLTVADSRQEARAAAKQGLVPAAAYADNRCVRSTRMVELSPARAASLLAAVVFGATAIDPAETAWVSFTAAAGLSIALAVGCVLVPWRRLPAWAPCVPAFAAFAVVAFERDAQGGGSSGYGILTLMPVVWLALTHGRRLVVAAGAAASAATIGLPVLIVGAPEYATTGWRATPLWFLASL